MRIIAYNMPGFAVIGNDGRTADYRMMSLIIMTKCLILFAGKLHHRPDDAYSKGDYGETNYQISG